MNKMTIWVLPGVLLLGAFTASAQETKRPSVPPLPTPPQTIGPRLSAAPTAPRPQAPVVAPASIVPVVPVQVAPQPFPAQPFPTQAFPPATVAAGTPASAGPLTALKFDAERKDYSSKPGELQAPFTFHLTNTSSAEVSITAVRTSCGCTVAKLPSTPWVIPPGQGGPIEVSVNLAGKSGSITKSVTVESSAGVKSLLVTVNMAGVSASPLVGGAPHPTMGDAERLKNMQLSLADRQVLFKNQDCAKCHAEPARSHTDGRQLYAAVCSVCHDSPIRAAMVPDLRTLKHPTDADYWRNWITYGRAGSMMPAFAQVEGGPLSEPQINALVDYMMQAYPQNRLPGILQQRQNSAGLRSPSVVSPAVAVPPASTPARTTPVLQ